MENRKHFVKGELIKMTRAEVKEINLGPRWESNPWPPEHRAGALSKIPYLCLLTTSHDDLGSANPSSMEDACYILTKLNDLALQEFT